MDRGMPRAEKTSGARRRGRDSSQHAVQKPITSVDPIPIHRGAMHPTVPLSAIRVFEAAARRRSFKAAAEELNRSASAVSHGVRKLEESLGVALFARAGQGVALTASGEALLDHVGRALEALNRGLDLVASRGPQLLRLHCAPSFAAQWLTPRLARFLREHPGIEVRLAAGMDYARFTNDEFDADIVYGPPRAEGLVCRVANASETADC